MKSKRRSLSISSDKLVALVDGPTEKVKVRRHFNNMQNALLEKEEELMEARSMIQHLQNHEES